MSWILLIVLYSGAVKEVHYVGKKECLLALNLEVAMGRIEKSKRISVAECFEGMV
jgi:hypothetical protein